MQLSLVLPRQRQYLFCLGGARGLAWKGGSGGIPSCMLWGDCGLTSDAALPLAPS